MASAVGGMAAATGYVASKIAAEDSSEVSGRSSEFSGSWDSQGSSSASSMLRNIFKIVSQNEMHELSLH